jgi:hypothetical protein
MLRVLLLSALLLIPFAAHADNDVKPDDIINVSLSTEGWVTTKTARVTVSVNAAVSADQAGTMRDTMMKSVGALSPKSEWRLTSFNRGQDETGLERWYASYEARLEENELGGLNAKAKAASKAGMQITIGNIDFTPTLNETEAVRGELRKQLLAMAAKELEAVNASLPGRSFRIAAISFDGARGIMPARQMMVMSRAANKAEMATMAPAMDMAAGSGGMETAQKLELSAQVTFAAVAPLMAPGTTTAK